MAGESNAEEPEVEAEDGGEEIEDLKRQLEEARALADERLDGLLRAQAELQNALRIVAREKVENAKYASEKLVCKLLCVLDSLDQASKHDEGSMVLHDQLLDILRTEGLQPIEAVGLKFDPYRHEALFSVKSEDAEEDTVAQEIQKGYLLGSKVIRFSKVAVVKR